ncbi:putative oxygenase MesX [Demequina sp. NBRC 110057]|uniref:putative oxygenase MesX n=1 Tax=Demequina sp. NBRC 110057 TaxID=1570346 RepID=UPI0009FD1B06|nr:putative oxygenase MesX [Demequina sp. NBRC 110057]
MAHEFTFSLTTTRFDEDYTPSTNTRATTNFANLARGEQREQNLRAAITMINRRVNDLVRWDNPHGDRYTLDLDIVSAELQFEADGAAQSFPLLEVLDIHVVDQNTGTRRHGIVGNNFSSYVRDYDFSVRLPEASAGGGKPVLPQDFGDLHGKLFQHFVDSEAYRERFPQAPVICISVSTSKTYVRTTNLHPVLGVEYVLEQEGVSLTDAYFAKMGLQVRYFMPAGSVAPLAFYFRGDLLNDYSDLQLAGTIATMETFQKIYRPEIYNANASAAATYRPSLDSGDFSRTQIDYDRVERSELGALQGKYTAEHFIEPHREILEQWAADFLAPVA